MRTTITLNENLVLRLKNYANAHHMRFKNALNDALQQGLNHLELPEKQKPYKTKSKKVGLKKGLNFDNVSELLEQVEGVDYQ